MLFSCCTVLLPKLSHGFTALSDAAFVAPAASQDNKLSPLSVIRIAQVPSPEHQQVSLRC
jgi:hypothetical protein